MNKAEAIKAYNDMCDKNTIPKSQYDELLFIAGFMGGYLSAQEAAIKRITDKLEGK